MVIYHLTMQNELFTVSAGREDRMAKFEEYLINNGYTLICRHEIKKGLYFRVYRAPEDLQPLNWCVSYCGGGTYWRTPRECLAYCYGRGFIRQPQIAELEQTIKQIIE